MYLQEIMMFMQQHMILSFIWVILLIVVLYTTINNWLFRSSEILCNTAILLINRKNAVVVDIRSKGDYYAGHIANSINVSVEDIKNGNIIKLNKIKNQPLIIAHDNSIVAHSIKKCLFKLNFEKVYILHGGMVGWKSDSLPVFLKK